MRYSWTSRSLLAIGFALMWMTALSWPLGAQSAVWQPQGAATGSIYYNGGNVGIGTLAPDAPLTFAPAAGEKISLYQTGNNYRFGLSIAPNGPYEFWTRLYGPDYGLTGVQIGSVAGASGVFTPAMTVLGLSGNVGIGTTTPQSKLAVNGDIIAKDVMVTSSGWPDYVFRPGYRLQPLTEVGAYIQANGHLPDIPTEAEVKEKGVSLGDMQAKLLAKIEELTLHMIRQDKENKELRERLARLEER